MCKHKKIHAKFQGVPMCAKETQGNTKLKHVNCRVPTCVREFQGILESVKVSIILGIREGRLYRVWGQPLRREGHRASYATFFRWQDDRLGRPTWWEWTQLEEMGYSNDFSRALEGNHSIDEVEFPKLEGASYSSSKGIVAS